MNLKSYIEKSCLDYENTRKRMEKVATIPYLLTIKKVNVICRVCLRLRTENGATVLALLINGSKSKEK